MFHLVFKNSMKLSELGFTFHEKEKLSMKMIIRVTDLRKTENLICSLFMHIFGDFYW